MNARVEATVRGGVLVRPRPARTAVDIVQRLTAVDSRTVVWCAALGAVIVGLIGLPLSRALNIWLDEAFTLHTTGAGVGMALSQAVGFEDQPPLYFMLEAGWRMLDEASFTFARAPSIVFAAAAVAVIVGAAHRIAPRTPPLVVATLAAFHPIIISAAVEMRVYALVLLIGAVLSWTFIEAFIVPRPSRTARIGFAIVALAGMYTQYFVGFVLLAQGLTILVLRRRSFPAFIGLMSVVAVGFAPCIRVALAQLRSTGDSVVPATFISSVYQVAGACFAYSLPHDLGWSGAAKIAAVVFAAVLIGTALVGGGPYALPRVARSIVLQLGVALFIFSVTFAVVGVPGDLTRHLVVLAPATLLAVCALLSSLRRMRLLACGFAVMVFALFAASVFWGQYHAPLAKPGDWQRVASLLRTDDSTAPIAVFPAELALPLHLYLPAAAIAIPRPMPFVLDYVAATTLTAESDVARVLDPLRTRSERLWLVTENTCGQPERTPYSYHCAYLEAFMRRHYRLAQSVPFRGLVVRRFVRLPTPEPKEAASEVISMTPVGPVSTIGTRAAAGAAAC